MNHKLSQLLAPSLGLYLFFLVLFTLASAMFSPALAGIEAVIVVVLYWYLRRSSNLRKKEMLRYIESVTTNMDVATRDTMLNSPLPMVIFQPDTDEVIWSNDRFLQLTDQHDHLFDTKLSSSIPNLDNRWLLEGKHVCPHDVLVDGRRFQVFGTLVRSDERRSRSTLLATTYWVDITEYVEAKEQFDATRPVVSILLLDNYEDAVKGADELQRSALLSAINRELAAWVQPTGGLLTRFDRNRYLFIFEEQYLKAFQDEKFAILDKIHDLQSPGDVPATLSIGIAKGNSDFKTLLTNASLSIEMALSRGGDQAVIKTETNFEFYGGRSKEMEKRTKVKSRVMANTLGALISDSSRVFVMGHKFSDLDCMGACAGVCAIARKRGATVHIVQEQRANPASDMATRLMEAPEYQGLFISPQEALIAADPRTLVVVVDTNRPEQVISQELLECGTRVAVIDHHRRAASYIANATLNFHEPYASSASELVAELLQYILEPSDLLKVEAEAVLAGIVLDTKNFTMRTGTRTFEAAAFLRRSGADTGDVKKLFQNNLDDTVVRYQIIQAAQIVHGDIAIAAVEKTVGRVTAAQAADELLNILGISTSFVLFPDESGQKIIISARSMGSTNVQVVLEKLGGGGNGATAGAQVDCDNVNTVLQQLMQAIEQATQEES